MLRQTLYFGLPCMLGYVRFEADVASAGKSRTVYIELDAGGGDALHHVGKQV